MIAKIFNSKSRIAKILIAICSNTIFPISECPIAKSSIAKCPIAKTPIAESPIVKSIVAQVQWSQIRHPQTSTKF